MVDVRVTFSHPCCDGTRKEWYHDFNVERGAQIRRLKEVMTLPEGTKQDADSFELRKNNRRVPDGFKIWQKMTVAFEYLGAVDGKAAAEKDELREKGEGEKELNISGIWVLLNQGDKNKIYFEIKHQPDAKVFRGHQHGAGDASDGKLIRGYIQWEIHGFKCRGRLQDDGCTIQDLTVKDPKGQLVGTYTGTRNPLEKCWSKHVKMDIKGRGDMETMPGKDLDAVKRRVEVMGYSGFALFKGNCYIKGGKPIAPEDLQYGGDEAEVTFYLFAKPDPFGDVDPNDEAAEDAAWVEEQAEKERKERDDRLKKQQEEANDPRLLRAQEEERKAAQWTMVNVKHALKEMESEIMVKVNVECKVQDVRAAVMEKIGEKKLSEVRFVKKMGTSWTSIDVDEPIGDRREFTSMGKKLVEVAVKKDAPTAAAAAAAEKLAPSVAPAAAPSKGSEAMVKITHSTSNYFIEISPAGLTTIMDVRKAAAAKIGCQHTHVRIVKRMGKDGTGGWQSVLDSKKLEDQTELFCMGSGLEKAPPGWEGPAPSADKPAPKAAAAAPSKPTFEDKDLTINISIDRGMNLEFPITCKKGTTIKDLKAMIVAADPGGGAKLEELFLGMPSSTKPLSDTTNIVEEHQSLDLIPKEKITS